MNVARILKDKGRTVVTVPAGASIKEAVNQLAAKKIGALVVCEGGGHVKGIITERDIVRILAAHGSAVLDTPVSQCMTTAVFTCTESATVNWLMEEMTSHRFRHMPVVENGRLTGIVSIGDVVKLRLAECELEADSMREYIKTG
jgi:CBS domain-containing protein